MSTLRVNTLRTIDDSFEITVEDLSGINDNVSTLTTNVTSLTNEVNELSDEISDLASFEKVDSYSALQEKTPSATGEIIYLVQYSSSNLYNGGGFFQAVDGAGTEDYGTICVPNSSTTQYWRRINYTDITPQMFGAICNGTTSDVTPFTRAISACNSQGKTLKLPDGTYYLASGISLSAAIDIVGTSQEKTIIKFANSVTGFTIAASTNSVKFKSLTITNVSTSKTSGYHGIYANGGSISTGSIGFLEIVDCNILGFDCGFYGVACQLGIIAHSTIWACNRGIYTKLCVNMRYDRCRIQLNSDWGIFMDGDSSQVSYSCGTLVDSCEIVNNGSGSGGSVYIIYNEHFTLNNCMIDAPATGSTQHVVVSGVSRGTISTCWIGASNGVGVSLVACTCVNIVGCNILAHATYGLTLTGACNGNAINANCFESNGTQDAVVNGTGCLYNIFSGNAFRTTGKTYSLSEGGSYYTCATGNVFTCATALNTGAGSVQSGNISLA